MSEPLSIERFRALAEAYGGTIMRWPPAMRSEALALAADEPAARAILERAAALDDVMGLWRSPQPTPELREGVLASMRRWRSDLRRRLRLWWTMAGIAAALAGLASGSLATAAALQQDQSVDGGTVFGDLGGSDN